jgi:hypothetical protein
MDAFALAHVQESTKKIRGLWDQIQSTIKSLQLVVASKTKEDKHLKHAFELRIETHVRVLDILNREKAQVLEAFKKAGGVPGAPRDLAAGSDDAVFWARIGELDATILKVRCGALRPRLFAPRCNCPFKRLPVNAAVPPVGDCAVRTARGPAPGSRK